MLRHIQPFLSAVICLGLALSGLSASSSSVSAGAPGADAPAVTPPAAISDLQASKVDGKVRLDWTPVTQDTSGQPITGVIYNIYRAQDAPYFLPAPGAPAYKAGVTGPPYTDPDVAVLIDPRHSTYYLVKAVYQGQLSEPSNRVGAFLFVLVGDSPCPPGNVSGCYYTGMTVTGASGIGCPQEVSAPAPGPVQVIQAGTSITFTLQTGDQGTGTFNTSSGAFSVSGALADPTVCTSPAKCTMAMSGAFTLGQQPMLFTGTGTITAKVLGVPVCTINFAATGLRTSCPESGGCPAGR